ncbi:alpha/beta hydrolase-fold protein [Amycolatopsis sp.]|uniref:alpha/beta hydrolase-fold protein n=1 Tax=Amycolatopsis sp. TaxID=37632 RepID=UPI002DFEC52D|nr:alpha/beta hydrolase-fold protein [Amycolatopsis sp.]
MSHATKSLAKILATLALTVLFGASAVLPASSTQLDTSAVEGLLSHSTANLGFPFSGWDVDVVPYGSNPRVLDVSFNSPLLRQRVTNRVYLPDSYTAAGSSSAVLYYLHGTVLTPLDNPVTKPITDNEALLKAVGQGGGAWQTDIFDFGSQLSRAHFLVVSPDSSATNSVCETCAWIDGRDDIVPNLPPLTATTMPADSFLHQELYPLIQTLFNVRSDRGGRGVAGFSMGAISAYLQDMLHPDDYAFAASVSGALDVVNDPLTQTIWDVNRYLLDQGYGTAITNPVEWHGFNPIDIASNLAGTDTTILSSGGDGCLPLTSLLAPDCVRLPALTNPLAAATETLLAQQFPRYNGFLSTFGVQETRVRYPGVHGANNHLVYSHDIVPLANSVFTRATTATPAQFSYRTAIPHFTIWGYDITVTRTTAEFLDLTGARVDGRQLVLHGSGVAEIRFPAAFQPGHSYQVDASASGSAQTQTVVADSAGRVTAHIPLPGASTAVTVSVQG